MFKLINLILLIITASTSYGASTTNSSEIRVTVVAYTGAPAGTYSDTVTVSIVAN